MRRVRSGGAVARGRIAVSVAVLAAVATGCSSLGGEPAQRVSSAPTTAPPAASHSTGPRPLPHETSVPDPSLPPPLVSMDIAHASEQHGKAVNITIDDGPDPRWTPKVLAVLAHNGVKAVFCMIGPQAAAHPDIVRQVVAAGHRLCDHTVAHNTAMDHRSTAYQKRQIMVAAHQIRQASGGVMPMYYRAPGGAFTPYSRQIAAAAGMRPLGWNVDAKDYERPGVPVIMHTVRDELPNGPTLLLHDGGGDRSQTVATLKLLLPWLRQHGYTFGFPVR